MRRLAGGPCVKGTILDLGGGGARLILEKPIAVGEVIQLNFPRRPGQVRDPGRLMIGQVLHAGGVPGRHIVGIGFGWYTGAEVESAAKKPRRALWSWARLLCGMKAGKGGQAAASAKRNDQAPHAMRPASPGERGTRANAAIRLFPGEIKRQEGHVILVV